MARKPRIHFPGAFYHVILRGNNKEQIFFSNEDREYFYFLISEGIRRYGYRVHGFCLMSNHVHLIIQVGDIRLSKIIQNLSFRYTRRINQLRDKIGHLFQGRYKAILIDADNYLLELIRYIHFNPVRANIVMSAEEYLWSSHLAYMGLKRIPWLTIDLVLGFFAKKYASALSRYIHFMQSNLDNASQKKFHTGNQQNFAVLGSDDFVQKLKNSPEIQVNSTLNLESLVRIICAHYSVDENDVSNKSQIRKYSRIRGIIA